MRVLEVPPGHHTFFFGSIFCVVRACAVHIASQRCSDLRQHFAATKPPRCRHLDVRLCSPDSASGECSCGSSRGSHNGHHSAPLPWLYQPLCECFLSLSICWYVILLCLFNVFFVCLSCTRCRVVIGINLQDVSAEYTNFVVWANFEWFAADMLHLR